MKYGTLKRRRSMFDARVYAVGPGGWGGVAAQCSGRGCIKPECVPMCEKDSVCVWGGCACLCGSVCFSCIIHLCVNVVMLPGDIVVTASVVPRRYGVPSHVVVS